MGTVRGLDDWVLSGGCWDSDVDPEKGCMFRAKMREAG